MFHLELWNTVTRRYDCMWSGPDPARAEIMFNKPYNARHTRRLVQVETTIVKQAKGKKDWRP